MLKSLHSIALRRLLPCAAVVLLLCACGKTVVQEPLRELSFRPAAVASTKADPELDGASLGTDNSYVMLASATADGKPYMTGQLYTWYGGDATWHGSAAGGAGIAGPYELSPVFWPLSGVKMDFLALALRPAAYDALTASGSITWNDDAHGGPAGGVTIGPWDTYAVQYDVMYAFRNGVDSPAGTLPLGFSHTMAVLGFTAKANQAGRVTINSITINGLEYSGTLTLDNTRTEFGSDWGALTAGDKALYKEALDPTTALDFPVGTEAVQCARHLLVPQQMSKSVTITYTMPHAVTPLTYVLPLPRMIWKAGRRYIYALDFGSGTEITASLTSGDWSSGSGPISSIEM